MFFNELRATKSESNANLYCYATAFVQSKFRLFSCKLSHNFKLSLK